MRSPLDSRHISLNSVQSKKGDPQRLAPIRSRSSLRFTVPALLLLAGLPLVGIGSGGPLGARRPAPAVATVASSPSTSEGQRPDPIDFSAAELRELNRRFGVHGPQPRLAQLFTEGLDQLRPLRSHTLSRLEELRPVIRSESQRAGINPMLVAAVLYDEMQHAKPGEDHPLAASSGLFSTHGPAQLSLGEMVKQGLLDADATPAEQAEARLRLLDPDRNVAVLVGKFSRLKRELGIRAGQPLMASTSPRDAKALATLAYLHNGKLDYPGRILRYMQDPELHGLLYGERHASTSPLI